MRTAVLDVGYRQQATHAITTRAWDGGGVVPDGGERGACPCAAMCAPFKRCTGLTSSLWRITSILTLFPSLAEDKDCLAQ